MLFYKGTCPSINLIPARMKSAAFLRMREANVVPASSIPMTEDSSECSPERRGAVEKCSLDVVHSGYLVAVLMLCNAMRDTCQTVPPVQNC